MRHLSVHVVPDAADDQVISRDDMLEVYTTKPAAGGQANKAVISLVRDHLSATGQIRIVAGHKQPRKILAVSD